MIYIIMGVSGVGKTTIGKLLAARLGLDFFDADDFHPPENLGKMSAGIPLEDKDRKQWLEDLGGHIREWNRSGGAVLACSALKEDYRQQLRSIPESALKWIFLQGDFDLILQRMGKRKGHFFRPHMLRSQFSTLEPPHYGLHLHITDPVETIIEKIMKHIHQGPAELGLIGLGVMGKSLALNLASKGVRLALYNRHLEGVEENIAKDFITAHDYDLQGFDDLGSFVRALGTPRKIILMVKAGGTVDQVIDELLPFLEKDDLILDGGNSHFKDTLRREQFLEENGIGFLGTGISGGEEGARKGPSIMPGGNPRVYNQVAGYLEKIAARDKRGNPCCSYIGPQGAGHFVKMLHNGIEYGQMQLIAEIYHLLRFSCQIPPEEIADRFEQWNTQQGSFLLEISSKILREREDSGFLLDKILDAAGQKGTGGWSTNAALELGVPLDTITAAVMARMISGKKQERITASGVYGISQKTMEPERLEQELFSAFKAAGIINHAIGFDLLKAASKEYAWELDYPEIARIWTNGCIIRSSLMEDLAEIGKEHQEKHLLLHPLIQERLEPIKGALKRVTTTALDAGFPMPVMSAAMNYLLSFTALQTSANMIQAQRDYFGAHTFERTDSPRGTFFHHHWKTTD